MKKDKEMKSEDLQSHTYTPIIARVGRMDIDQMPGCCCATVISGFYDGVLKHHVPEATLAAAEEYANGKKQNVVLAIISKHQKEGLGCDQLLEKRGWKLVHTFPGRTYGGGEDYLYAKNLTDAER